MANLKLTFHLDHSAGANQWLFGGGGAVPATTNEIGLKGKKQIALSAISAMVTPKYRRQHGENLMSSRDTRLMISQLAEDIGLDASHFRKEQDRLYLTGIEIAILIATGVLSSFFLGLFNGVKKRMNKYGEELGEKLVNQTLGQLIELRTELEKIDTSNVSEAKKRVDHVQSKLDEVLNRPELNKVTLQQLQELRNDIHDEIKSYLRQIGFPEETAEEDTFKLIDRVEESWID